MSVQWQIFQTPVLYNDALDQMKQRVQNIYEKKESELVWFLEHPPLYTAGSSAKQKDLLDQNTFPVFETGRGGQYTYHGPGQRVIYLMLDLNQRGRDLKAYVRSLEEWIIQTLQELGVSAQVYTNQDRVGVWVGDEKIAAIGVRVQKWVTSHGVALNINPNLDHYQGIVPCGLPQFGVTSLKKLGINVQMSDVDAILQQTFRRCVGE